MNEEKRHKVYHKRKYVPMFPEKYAGDPTNIIMRSSWETRFALWCDRNPAIVKWSSEETVIPYLSPVDGKMHRYFVDFKIKTKDNRVFLVEIKPQKETVMPKKSNNKVKYLEESKKFLVNQAKWKYAEEYAKDRNYNFIVLTEKELGL